jgi:hypothetical protein
MSVPLDRLYHYLDDCVNHDLLIYGWSTHGSRNLDNLIPWLDYSHYEFLHHAPIICHDQEPLNFLFYSQQQLKQRARKICLIWQFNDWITDPILDYMANQNLRGAMQIANQFDLTMLLHSELNSVQVDRYAQNGFVPVYYWAHAVIAQDWFRYAEHDPELHFDLSNIKQDFLVYNRAWSGTREYRLYFADQLVNQDMLDHVQIKFNPVDEQHYTQHVFKNKSLQITNFTLEQHLSINSVDATASADYVSKDYASTAIEVVLETLFDDTKWHLTEKTLRPIACGKPFILAATSGSLQYLRDYGFETFADVIDESYDTITDSKHRLDAIVAEMKRIAALDTDAKQVLYTKLHKIAQRNKQRFFNGMVEQVIDEYKTNLNQAMAVMQQHCTGRHRTAIRQLLEQN